MVTGRSLTVTVGLVASALAVTALFIGVAHSFTILMTGSLTGGELTILRGNWVLVIASIAVFLAFFALIPVRVRRDWRSHGVYAAFIVSLFAEMFGFPLSVYFLSGIFAMPLLEQYFLSYMYQIGMPAGSLVTFLGILLIILGWREIYHAKDRLVTEGVYGYLRHPQYLGIILVTGGWLIHWPTIPSIILWPVLIVLYLRLSKREEEYLTERFGEEYTEYAKRIPMLIPRLPRQSRS